MRRSLALAVGVLLLGGLTSHSDAQVQGQSQSVTITITSSSSEAIRFRGALIFEQGGFQGVDGVTPMEVRGGGVAVGIFERVGEGPELRVRLSAGRGEVTGTAGRVIVGSDVVKGVTNFVRVF